MQNGGVAAAAMSQRLRFSTARDLFDAFPTASEDIAAEPADRPALDYMAELVAGQTPEDGITFCAYLLPKREAVWWAHQCLYNLAELLSDEDHQMLALAERWVRYPEEDERNAVLDAGMASKSKTPGVWVALAAGWSDGSMMPPDAAPVDVPPYLTAKAVNAGVLSALARVDRKSRADTLKLFANMGMQLLTRA
jgi:Family of unknown function (DUF6931)